MSILSFHNFLHRFLYNIAALGDGYKAVLYLTRYTASSVTQQCSKFIFKVIFLMCLADEIQNGQAFLILGQT